VDGTPTDVADFPWQVAIIMRAPDSKMALCGGALIEKRWIVTAAHCFGKQGKSAIAQVKSGVNRFQSEGSWIRAVRVIPHPGYYDDASGYAVRDDIALVMIGSDANGVAVPNANSSPLLEGETLELTGWGTISDGSAVPSAATSAIPKCPLWRVVARLTHTSTTGVST
jgi:secreted trypsin-like serine protease